MAAPRASWLLLSLSAAALLSAGVGAACTAKLTRIDVIKLGALIRDRIHCFNNATDDDGVRYHPLIAGLVRLAFHASVDRQKRGCLNLNDPRQTSLRATVEEMERLYVSSQADGYYARISRADFWILGGITALEAASAFSLSANFNYGRCDDCGDSFETDAMIDLPDQVFTGEQAIGYMIRVFGMNRWEAVAIMGAHSLGVVTDAGRNAVLGKWVPNPEVLSNGYFNDMRDSSLRWRQVPRFYTLLNRTVWSWTHSDGRRVYLNCDMGLYKAFSVPDPASGISDCTYAACPLARSAPTAIYYATDAVGFRAQFRSAFQKMIDYGHSDLRAPV